MDDITYAELERKWAEANEAFKLLDAEYKRLEAESIDLIRRANEIVETAPKSAKARLYEEERERRADLSARQRAEVDAVTERANREIAAIQDRYHVLSVELEQELKPRIAAAVGIFDDDDAAAEVWDEYDPTDDVDSAEYDRLWAEHEDRRRIMSKLSDPRNEARRTLNKARSDKLAARRSLVA